MKKPSDMTAEELREALAPHLIHNHEPGVYGLFVEVVARLRDLERREAQDLAWWKKEAV